MARYVISPAAEHDIEAILAWTQEQFGTSGRLRYEALLVCAILDVANDAELAGSQKRPEITPVSRTYHLWHSRKRVNTACGRVNHPRHILLYRTCGDGGVEIGRVLHDSMDLSRHLPEAYRSIDENESEFS